MLIFALLPWRDASSVNANHRSFLLTKKVLKISGILLLTLYMIYFPDQISVFLSMLAFIVRTIDITYYPCLAPGFLRGIILLRVLVHSVLVVLSSSPSSLHRRCLLFAR